MLTWFKGQSKPNNTTSPIEKFSRRVVNRMYPIFSKQGYRNAKVGKIIRGNRNIIIPIYPSLEDISSHRDLHSKWVKLSENIGTAAGSTCYAEWSEKCIYYFIQLPNTHWMDLKFSDTSGIGQTEYGRVIKYKFNSSYPHSLVAGSTGSGKSVGLESIIFSLIRDYPPEELGLVLIDPHDSFGRREDVSLGTFDNIPHLVFGFVARNPEDINTQLKWAYSELGKRKTLSREEVFGLRRIVIVADELASQEVLGKGRNLNKEHLDIFNVLGAESRKYKIHIIGGTQKPEEIDQGVFDHLLYRFVGRTSDNKLGSRILGHPGYKVSALSGSGDFLVSEDFITRFQFSLTERKDFENLPRGKGIELVNPPIIDIGRIEIEEIKKPGRPSLEIDYEKLAYYMFYGDLITEEAGRLLKKIQLKRRGHELHRDAARTLVNEIVKLKKSRTPFRDLERITNAD